MFLAGLMSRDAYAVGRHRRRKRTDGRRMREERVGYHHGPSWMRRPPSCCSPCWRGRFRPRKRRTWSGCPSGWRCRNDFSCRRSRMVTWMILRALVVGHCLLLARSLLANGFSKQERLWVTWQFSNKSGVLHLVRNLMLLILVLREWVLVLVLLVV